MKYLIALIALLLPTYLIRFEIIGSVPTTLLEIVIYLVFFYGLFNIGYSQMLNVKKKVWLPIGLLLFAVLLSVYVAPEKTAALGQAKAYFIDPLLVFWLITCYLDVKDMRWVLHGLAGSSLVVSGYAIIERILHRLTNDGRVVGLFGYSPNYTALFLAPVTVLFISYGLLIYKKNRLMAILSFVLSTINLFAIYLTGSRAGYLAVLAGMGFFAIAYFWKKIIANKRLKYGLLGLIVVLFVGLVLVFKPNFNASGGRVTSSNNLRWQIWQTSLEMIKNNPVLGVGLGNFQNAFGELTKDRVNFPEFITPMAFTPHNIFLMFYLTTGLLGFATFVWLIVYFYQTGFKHLTTEWSKILMSGMFALLSQGLVDTPYFKNDLSLLFWLIFGFMILLNKDKKISK